MIKPPTSRSVEEIKVDEHSYETNSDDNQSAKKIKIDQLYHLNAKKSSPQKIKNELKTLYFNQDESKKEQALSSQNQNRPAGVDPQGKKAKVPSIRLLTQARGSIKKVT